MSTEGGGDVPGDASSTGGFVEGLEGRELDSAKNSPELLQEHLRVTGVSSSRSRWWWW